MKTEFTQNEMEVIRERHLGWERASCKLLAAVFETSPQKIAAICNIASGRPPKSTLPKKERE